VYKHTEKHINTQNTKTQQPFRINFLCVFSLCFFFCFVFGGVFCNSFHDQIPTQVKMCWLARGKTNYSYIGRLLFNLSFALTYHTTEKSEVWQNDVNIVNLIAVRRTEWFSLLLSTSVRSMRYCKLKLIYFQD